MPAVATLSPQQRRLYTIIYDFRLATPPDDPSVWIGDLQELAGIGPLAVPMLVTELDRAKGDSEQRLLIVALRIIGDSRAVPALIRALQRLAP